MTAKAFRTVYKPFPENPHAAADAYLVNARGFDVSKLKGTYTQELFRNDRKYPDLITATVRFKLAEGVFWERFIDRPERFGRQKANFMGHYKVYLNHLET
ncbi:hypothetical protein ACT453_40080, partial [Bacillus sp. D-CC]